MAIETDKKTTYGHVKIWPENSFNSPSSAAYMRQLILSAMV